MWLLHAGHAGECHELLSQVEQPSRDEIRDALSGNYCRCTGYEAIVDAIDAVAKARREGGGAT